jgi:hypothetical protein
MSMLDVAVVEQRGRCHHAHKVFDEMYSRKKTWRDGVFMGAWLGDKPGWRGG